MWPKKIYHHGKVMGHINAFSYNGTLGTYMRGNKYVADLMPANK